MILTTRWRWQNNSKNNGNFPMRWEKKDCEKKNRTFYTNKDSNICIIGIPETRKKVKDDWSEVKWKSLSCVWGLCNSKDFPWNSPGQNTGEGSLSLLQGIFPTQGSNPDLPHCKWILYQLSHKGSPKMTKNDPKFEKRQKCIDKTCLEDIK